MNTPEPSLAGLVAPLTVDEFLSQYWQKKHLALAGPLARFGDSIAQLASPSVEDLLGSVGGLGDRVHVTFTDRQSMHRSLDVSARDALHVYAAGMTLFFPYTNPFLHSLLRLLEQETGRRPGQGVTRMFASPSGGGTRAHFDNNEQFTIQLRGQKLWRLSRSNRIEAPVDNWITGHPVPLWLRRAAPDGLPSEMLRDAEVVNMQPGTVLYVPAGYWHETEANEDSLSLGFFLVGGGTWLDVLRPAIEALLESDPAVRAYATGVWAEHGRTRAAHEELDRLLELVRARLALVRARDLWGRRSDEVTGNESIPNGARLRRSPLGYMFVKSSNSEVQTVQVGGPGEDLLEFTVPGRVAPMLRWLRERDDTFAKGEALGTLDGDPDVQEQAEELLNELVAFGYLSLC